MWTPLLAKIPLKVSFFFFFLSVYIKILMKMDEMRNNAIDVDKSGKKWKLGKMGV